MPWPQTGAAHNHAELVLPYKDCAIKGIVVCYVEWLGSLKGMPKILTLVYAISVEIMVHVLLHFNKYSVWDDIPSQGQILYSTYGIYNQFNISKVLELVFYIIKSYTLISLA